MLFGSVATGVGERHFAGFPAIRTIVKAIGAQPDVMLAFANSAIFFAGTALFSLIAYRAEDGTGHGEPPRKTVPEGTKCGKAHVSNDARVVYLSFRGSQTAFIEKWRLL
jgi:hypothetical protein